MSDFFQQSSSLFPAGIGSMSKSRLILIAVIVIIIIICIYAYVLYTKRKKEYVEILGPYGLSTEHLGNPWLTLTSAEDSQKLISANNVTFSFFIYVQTPTIELNPLTSPEGNFENIDYTFVLGSSLGIFFDPLHQLAGLDIHSLSVPGDSSVKQIIIKKRITFDNLSQRWNQITVSIEGRTVDIYTNGILTSSTLLENIPLTEFFAAWLNKSPDFVGQICYFQIWPKRRTASEILDNYRRVTDVRGKPLVPDFQLQIKNLFQNFCSVTGVCGFRFDSISPLKYIDYEFA